MIKIGLMGFGTVGTGVYRIIKNREKELSNLLNKEIEIKKILVKDINKIRDESSAKELLTENADEILNDSEINMVVEVIGGMEPAFEYICTALNKGKHVVTANKEVVARHLKLFLQLAEENNCNFRFEACVGGGIPIIKALNEMIPTNSISKVEGILNGTSNFVLTKMMDDCTSFNESLSLAQKLGYAEADPKADIEGDDVVRKLAILSSLAFREKIDVDSIFCRGIKHIAKSDVANFKKMNKSIKLIATAVKNQKGISASVEPVLVGEKSQFANVNDCFNIVSLTGSTVQELQFYGQGAGEKPTGNAVVRDIIDSFSLKNRGFKVEEKSEKPLIDSKIEESDYYFRMNKETLNAEKSVFDLLDKMELKYQYIEELENSAIRIKSVYTDDMERFIDEFKKINDDFCYARIERKK